MTVIKDIKTRFVETELEHWNDIAMLKPRFLSSFVFRGQGNYDWHIKSSLERMIERFHPNGKIQQKIYPSGYEKDMLKEFQWKYPKYEKLNIPRENEVIEWLSIMQHYGCPTRMVDFSYSPYIALFMAIDSADGLNPSSIWCLNKLVLRMMYSHEYKLKTEKSLDSKEMQDAQMYEDANMMLNDCIQETRKDFRPNIYLVQPHRVNERILLQQGLFAIPEKIDVPFEDNLFSLVYNREPEFVPFKEIIEYSESERMFTPYDYFLIKIKIPAEFRLYITETLSLMNISAETMYPGLEGLAKSLNRQHYW